MPGDNTEKILADRFFVKAKNGCSWGSRGSCKPAGDLGGCRGEGVGAKPPNNFFFRIKHTKSVTVMVNIG